MMKKYLLTSAELVNNNIILVLLLTLFNLNLRGGIWLTAMFIIISLCGLVIYPGVYGFFIELAKYGKNEIAFLQNIKKHIINYFITITAIFLPVVLIERILKGPNLQVQVVFQVVLQLIVGIATIYILPIVFLEEINIKAIPQGLKFLSANIKYSVPLLALVLLSTIIQKVVSVCLVFILKGNLFTIVPVMYLLSFICIYIHLVVFLTASMILINKGAVCSHGGTEGHRDTD